LTLELKKKLNHEWDSPLSPEQKEMVIKPGFGLSQFFPYMNPDDVKEYMNQIEQVIQNLEIKIKEKYQ
jgi:hypothetical protein